MPEIYNVPLFSIGFSVYPDISPAPLTNMLLSPVTLVLSINFNIPLFSINVPYL